MNRTIEYVCPFVPPELISAWGFTPCRKKLLGGNAGDGTVKNSARHHHNLSAGVCPIAESMLFEFCETSAAGVIFSTTCDQMRRAQEIFAERRPDVPSFLLNVPASWQDGFCLDYYHAELVRLGEFLCGIGGRRPDAKKLAETVRQHARLRGEKIATDDGDDSRIKLAIVGSELRGEDEWIFSYIREFGGKVSLDATCNGEMTVPGCDLPKNLDAGPLRSLAEIYFAMPHPRQRPDSRFFDYVTTQVVNRNISGVILIRMSWCDTCHGFARRLKNSLSVPLLEIAQADQSTARAHTQGRLCAFMEMLK